MLWMRGMPQARYTTIGAISWAQSLFWGNCSTCYSDALRRHKMGPQPYQGIVRRREQDCSTMAKLVAAMLSKDDILDDRQGILVGTDSGNVIACFTIGSFPRR